MPSNPLLNPAPRMGNPLLAPRLTGADLEAMAGLRNPLLQAYEPSLRERIGNAVYDAAQAVGLGGRANRMRGDVGAVVDFVPGVGDIVGIEEGADAFDRGDYLGAAAGVVGVVPVVGDMAKPIAKSVDDLVARAAEMGVDLSLSPKRNSVVVNKIVVPKERRGQGVGSQVMKDITAFADANGKTLSLDPSTDFGGSSKAALERFYKRFGFEKNAGRSRDFEISEAMRRYAK